MSEQMTPGQAWERFVGDQTVEEFVAVFDDHETIADYVDNLPDMMGWGPSHDGFFAELGQTPETIARLLEQYIANEKARN